MTRRFEQVFVGSNLKMYKTNRETAAYARELQILRCDLPSHLLKLFILPSYTALAEACQVADPDLLWIGAQNMHWEAEGAFTGEVSARMLADIGVKLVMVGHAERRHKFWESDEQVNWRLRAALNNGFQALLCVGDTLEDKQADRSSDRLIAQTTAALQGIRADSLNRLWVAYEPVWSIGESGTPASPENADQMHAAIRKILADLFPGKQEAIPILYGGSVNLGNAAALISQPQIDGLFIGRAAWEAQNFNRILHSVFETYQIIGGLTL